MADNAGNSYSNAFSKALKVVGDYVSTPSPRTYRTNEGKEFDPSKFNGKPFPKVERSVSEGFSNLHPIDYAYATIKGFGNLPQAPEAFASLLRGRYLMNNQQNFYEFKRTHPKVPDSANPYLMTPAKYNEMRYLEAQNPSSMMAGNFGAKRYPKTGMLRYGAPGTVKNPQLEMQKDLYVMKSLANTFSWVDPKTGIRHFDENRLNAALNTHPEAVITTIVPLFGAATRLGQSGGIAGALARLEAGGGAAGALAKGARFTGSAAATATKVIDPVGQVLIPKAAGALVKGAIRATGSNKINILNPEFSNAWESWLAKNRSENPTGFMDDPKLQDHFFSEFQRETGGKYPSVFTPEAAEAMRKAGIDPVRLSSPSQWGPLQYNLSRTGEVITPAGVRQAVAKAAGAKQTTRGMATGQSANNTWATSGNEQAMRDAASGQVSKNLQDQFKTDANSALIAKDAVDNVLSGRIAGEINFQSPTFGRQYGYNPATDTFTFDRGSGYIPRPGSSRYVTIDSNNPQFGILKAEVSQEATAAGLGAANRSPDSILNDIALKYGKGTTDPAALARSIEGQIGSHILEPNGSIKVNTAKGSFPGEVNYSSLRQGLTPEGQAALDARLRQQLAGASNPNEAMRAADLLQAENPNLFTPDARANLNTGLTGKTVTDAPVLPQNKTGPINWIKENVANSSSIPATALAYAAGSLSIPSVAAAMAAKTAYTAGKQLIGRSGAFDRFGMPVALDPNSLTASLYRPGQSMMAAPEGVSRVGQGLIDYGTQFDESQKPKPQAALPPPVIPPSFAIDRPPEASATGTAKAPAANNAQKDYWADLPTTQGGEFSTSSAPPQNGYYNDLPEDPAMQAAPRRQGGRIAYKKGGAVKSGVEPLVQSLMARYKAVKRSQDSGTKPLLQQPDQAIVKALGVAQKAI